MTLDELLEKFYKQVSRSYTEANIKEVDKDVIGVYAIRRFDGDKMIWIYVGEGQVRDRMLDHLRGTDNEADKCIKKSKPTNWKYLEVPKDTAKKLQDILIEEEDPPCNAQGNKATG